MSLLSELIVRITAQTSDFQRDLVGAQRSMMSVGRSMTDIGKSLSVGVSAPLLGVGLAALKVAGDMESAKIGFTTLLGSGQAATAMLKDLRAFALGTPFNFPDLVTASQRMMAMGFAAKEVIPSLTAIGNATSALGRGPETLDRITLALGQMRNSAKVSAQDMNQLTQAGIDGWGILAKASGLSIKEIREQAKDLFTGAEAASLIMAGMTDKFKGAMEEQAKGLKGLWSNVQDSVMFALGDIGNALLPFGKDFIKNNLQPMLDGLTSLANAFGSLSPSTQTAVLGMAGFTAAAPLAVFAMGTIITQSAVVIGALNKLAKAWEMTTLGLVSRIGLWSAAAFEIGRLVLAYSDWQSAEKAAAKAGQESADALRRLAISLRQNGVAGVNELEAAYNHGEISQEKFQKGLAALAVEHGKSITVVKTATVATESHGAALEKTAEHAKAARDAIAEFGNDLSAQLIASIPSAHELAKATVEIGRAAMEAALSYASIMDAFPPQLSAKTMRDLSEAAKESGITFEVKLPAAIEKTTVAQKKATVATKEGIEVWKKFGNQVSLIINDVSRNLTDLIFKGGKLKDMMSKVFEDIGKAIVRAAIEAQLKRLAMLVVDLLSKSAGLGKVLGAIFGAGGSGASAAGGVASAAGGAASAAGSATSAASGAGGAVTAATSSLASTVTAIASAATAISSVIGNFQMAGMNASLGLIEKSTRYSEIYLYQTFQKALEWWPKLDHLVDIWGAVNNLAAVGGGGGNVYFQPGSIVINGGSVSPAQVQDAMRQAVRQLRSAGLKY